MVPASADVRDRLKKLKDTWTKGGKYREIAICTPEQRDVLNATKRLAVGHPTCARRTHSSDFARNATMQAFKVSLAAPPICGARPRGKITAVYLGDRGRFFCKQRLRLRHTAHFVQDVPLDAYLGQRLRSSDFLKDFSGSSFWGGHTGTNA